MNRFSYFLIKNRVYSIIINVFILYSLVGDYFRIMIFNAPADVGFDVLTIICVLLFGMEIILQLNVQ
jgi:hypothetical protein